MAKRITPEQLATEINAILKEYNESVTEGTKEAVRKVVKWGVNEVRAGARSNFESHSGKYASGWTSTIESGRMNTSAVIHNRKTPGLPHLLENGHANRNGGRTPGRVHIAPVNDEVQRLLVETIEASIRSS